MTEARTRHFDRSNQINQLKRERETGKKQFYYKIIIKQHTHTHWTKHTESVWKERERELYSAMPMKNNNNNHIDDDDDDDKVVGKERAHNSWITLNAPGIILFFCSCMLMNDDVMSNDQSEQRFCFTFSFHSLSRGVRYFRCVTNFVSARDVSMLLGFTMKISMWL